jgi:hypothetical protein
MSVSGLLCDRLKAQSREGDVVFIGREGSSFEQLRYSSDCLSTSFSGVGWLAGFDFLQKNAIGRGSI